LLETRMSDIFISYASADREKAKALAAALESHGWSVWWDRIIPPGRQFDEVIEEALDSARCVVVLWSKSSVTSSWVKTEAADAMRRKILVPALIEDVKLPLEFRRLQAADLSRWNGDPSQPDLDTLLNSLKTEIAQSEHGERSTINPPSAKPPDADLPSSATAFVDSALAQVAGKSKRKLALVAVLIASVVVAVVVGYQINSVRSAREEPAREQTATRPSTQSQDATGAGVWMADAKGCKLWDYSPKPKESVTWSGGCVKGKADGDGTAEWFVDGQRHERITGRLSEGKPDGVVTVYEYASGTSYEGRLENGKPTGKATITSSQGKLEGNFVDGKLSGNVVVIYANGSRYEGEQKNGLRTHKGVWTEPNGARYVGDFVDFKFQGYGIMTWPNGNRYEGDFKDGQQTGKGILTDASGGRYVGDFVAGKFHGRGVLTNAKGQRYEGNFIAGQIAR
jgi:hypothetical protein